MPYAAALLALLLAPQNDRAVDSLRDLVNRPFDATVSAVIDGDTVEVVRDGERLAIRVRLEGVDTPERGEPYNDQARRFTRALLFSQRVRVTAKELDAYGRLVARLRRGTHDASVELVRAGLACHFTRYSDDSTLRMLQAEAQSLRRGFWAATARPTCTRNLAPSSTVATGRQAPAAVRQQQTSRASTEAGPLHGNVSSRVYHASWCPNYRCRNCTALFGSEDAARRQGFRPAQDCLGQK
jgi:endonuclease YncB( thermonuclease family)